VNQLSSVNISGYEEEEFLEHIFEATFDKHGGE